MTDDERSAVVGDLFRKTDREVWVVTAKSGDQRGGLVATSVSQASIVPDLPRVTVSISRQHFTWELIESAGAFCLNLLSASQQELVWHFGLQSQRDVDKFEGLPLDDVAMEGDFCAPVIADVAGWLYCRVEADLDCGDRTLYLAEVVSAGTHSNEPPLTIQSVIKQARPEKLVELHDQMTRNAAIDTRAIQAWRRR